MEFVFVIIGSNGFIGFFLSFMAPLLRSFCLQRKFLYSDCHFWFLLCLSIAGNLFAFFGLHQLASSSDIAKGECHAVLEILALLSAGAIAGFWAIEYKDAARDEKHILNIVSALFVLVFYALFFSICFYIGKSNEFQNTPLVSWVVPGIMMLLLDINAVIDIWDYRKDPLDP